MIYVGLRVVPMGWVAATDIAQHIIRRLVYNESGVAPKSEVRKDRRCPPKGKYSPTYLDGFDQILETRLTLKHL